MKKQEWRGTLAWPGLKDHRAVTLLDVYAGTFGVKHTAEKVVYLPGKPRTINALAKQLSQTLHNIRDENYGGYS